MRRIALILIVAGLLVALSAMPALAFVHGSVPVEDCAASEQAGENPTARNALLTQGAVAQGAQTLPIGNAQAGTDCPAPQK